MEKISINKNALVDLVRLKEEFDSVVESIELMNDKKIIFINLSKGRIGEENSSFFGLCSARVLLAISNNSYLSSSSLNSGGLK